MGLLNTVLIESKVRTDIQNMVYAVPFGAYNIGVADKIHATMLEQFHSAVKRGTNGNPLRFKGTWKIYLFRLFRLLYCKAVHNTYKHLWSTNEGFAERYATMDFEGFERDYVSVLVDDWASHEPNILKYLKDVESWGNLKTTVDVDRVITELAASLTHISGLEYPKIREYDFTWQTPSKIYQDMAILEKEYLEYARQAKWRDLKPEDEIIVDMGEYKWVNTHRASCTEEAADMRHCGNSGAKRGDVLLSLRKFRKGKYKSVLTFILNTEDGRMGEMKGPVNEKPSPEYHPHILELFLKYPDIQGFGNARYLPENNFSVFDFSFEMFLTLIRKRPDIIPTSIIIERSLANKNPDMFALAVPTILDSINTWNNVDVSEISYDPATDLIKAVYEIDNISNFIEDWVSSDKLIGDIQSSRGLTEDKALLGLLLDNHEKTSVIDIEKYISALFNDTLIERMDDLISNPSKYFSKYSYEEDNQSIIHKMNTMGHESQKYYVNIRAIVKVWDKVSQRSKNILLDGFLNNPNKTNVSNWTKSVRFTEDGQYVISLLGEDYIRSYDLTRILQDFGDLKHNAPITGTLHKPEAKRPLKVELEAICNELANDRSELEDILTMAFY